MGQRVIPVAVTAEYIGGDGVTLGAAGSHNSVVIEYDFRAAGPMWEGTTKYVLWTNPQGNSTNRVDLGVDKLVDGYENVYHASPTADAMCVAGWAEMVVVGVTVETTTDEDSGETTSKETLKVKTEPSRFRVLPGSSRASDNEGVAATVADQLQTEIEAVDRRKVNKPVTPYDPNGEEGQYLVSLGDGRTKWEGINEDIIERILERHPDWITDLQDGEVSTKKIADGAVSPEKIQNSAVTTEKIKNSAVTTGKLADGAVTTQKIANGAVTRQKLASDVSNTLAQLQAESATKTELNEAVDEIHQHLTSPYNFKGAVAEADLPTASAANVNDTYYLTDHKYRVTSNGTSWEQSSLDEADYEDELGVLEDAVLEDELVTGEQVNWKLNRYLNSQGGISDPSEVLPGTTYAAESTYIRVRPGDIVRVTPESEMMVRIAYYQQDYNAETRTRTMVMTGSVTDYRKGDTTIQTDCHIRCGIRREDRGAFELTDARAAVIILRTRHRAEGQARENVLDLVASTRNVGFYKNTGETEQTHHTSSHKAESQPIPVVPGTEYRLEGTYSRALGYLEKPFNPSTYVKVRACAEDGTYLYIQNLSLGLSGRNLTYKGQVTTADDLPYVRALNHMYYIVSENRRVRSTKVDGSYTWASVTDDSRVYRGQVDTEDNLPADKWLHDTVYVKSHQILMEWDGSQWVEIEDEQMLNTTFTFPDGVHHIVINYPQSAMKKLTLTTYTGKDYVARQQIGALRRDLDEQMQVHGTQRKNDPAMVAEMVDVAKSYLGRYTTTPDPTFGLYDWLKTQSAATQAKYYETDPVTGEPTKYHALVYGYHSPIDDGFGEPENGSRELDCSSYVGMVLRGITFDESLFKLAQTADRKESTDSDTVPDSEEEEDPVQPEDSEESDKDATFDPYSNNANPRFAWSVNPYEWSLPKNNQFDADGSSIRSASQLAHWMHLRGQEITIDRRLSNLDAGDLVFFTRYDITEPISKAHVELRWRHINHVAIVMDKILATRGPYDSKGNRILRDGDIISAVDWDGNVVAYSGEPWDAEKYPYIHRIIHVSGGPGNVATGILETIGGGAEGEATKNNVRTMSMCCRPDLGSMRGAVTLDKAASVPTDEAPEGTIRFDADAIYVRTASGWKMVYLTDVPNA